MGMVLVNDRLVSRGQAAIDIEDRGYQFGDGIYEVFSVYGGKPFLLDEHLIRLERSAQELQLKLPYDRETLKSKLIDLYRTDGLVNGIVYLQITRGAAPRDHAFPEADVPPQLIAYTIMKERPIEFQSKGVSAILTEDIRWLRVDIKSLNLLGNVLAKQKAKDAGAFEAILHRGSTVTEGSSTNVFIVKDGTLLTHPANHLILNGITRSKVLELCRVNGIPVTETPFSTGELLSADEVFITGSYIEIVPIVQLERRPVSGGLPGPMTTRLQQLINNEIDVISPGYNAAR